eukprot:scaffold102577_cov18-Tisochrysis_lutea.AAC.1
MQEAQTWPHGVAAHRLACDGEYRMRLLDDLEELRAFIVQSALHIVGLLAKDLINPGTWEPAGICNQGVLWGRWQPVHLAAHQAHQIYPIVLVVKSSGVASHTFAQGRQPPFFPPDFPAVHDHHFVGRNWKRSGPCLGPLFCHHHSACLAMQRCISTERLRAAQSVHTSSGSDHLSVQPLLFCLPMGAAQHSP